jgi:hypothetical protein
VNGVAGSHQLPDRSKGMHAVLSLVGRSLGFDHLPLPRSGSHSAPLLDVETAVGAVCESGDCVPAPVRLNLLSYCCPRVKGEALEPIAMSLIRNDLDADPHPHVSHLLDRGYRATKGADPLDRHFATLPRRPKAAAQRATTPGAADMESQAAQSPTSRAIVPDAQNAVLDMKPTCTATTQMIGGFPALSLSTTAMSKQTFDEARAMTNPLFWSECPPQSLFFKKMEVVGDRKQPLPGGRDGWSGRILEVVDFSYGLDDSGESEMRTELDFVYFESEFAAGCTYDLHRSLDGEILVDRGFVMTEDLRSVDWRRTTTLKQVYFRTRSNPGDVCQFWSLAQGVVSSSCSNQRPAA